jgi:hypothetical protein
LQVKLASNAKRSLPSRVYSTELGETRRRSTRLAKEDDALAEIAEAPEAADQEPTGARPRIRNPENNNNNNDNNKHAYAGSTDSCTHLRVLLVLTDRGISAQSN